MPTLKYTLLEGVIGDQRDRFKHRYYFDIGETPVSFVSVGIGDVDSIAKERTVIAAGRMPLVGRRFKVVRLHVKETGVDLGYGPVSVAIIFAVVMAAIAFAMLLDDSPTVVQSLFLLLIIGPAALSAYDAYRCALPMRGLPPSTSRIGSSPRP